MTATGPLLGSTKRSVRRRAALLGTGYIAEWHAKALASIRDVDLVAVCDLNTMRAKAFAEKFRVPRTYSALQTMLEAEKLHAVHVLLPPDLHFAAAQMILNAGIDVLLEKPMCSDVAECQLLIDLAGQTGRRVAVGHNFLFYKIYRQLRDDLKRGVLGRVDKITLTWHRELSQLTEGRFDIWMLRDPRNVMLEVAAHLVSQLLDLTGYPDELGVETGNPIDLPSGQRFFRRWRVDGCCGATAVEMRFSFVPGFPEYSIEVRGSLGSGKVDFDRNTYLLTRHLPLTEDFERYAIVRRQGRLLRAQARRTLLKYIFSKFSRRWPGSPYGVSIANELAAFYSSSPLPEGIVAQAGAEVVRLCSEIADLVPLSPKSLEVSAGAVVHPKPTPRILVLGGTGFIGRELVQQLVQAQHDVRLLVRQPGKLVPDLNGPHIEALLGDLDNEDDLQRAMTGIDCLFHLARPQAKSWKDWERFEIRRTEQIAKLALAAGVKRFIYTGTIDCYYAGSHAVKITEETGLDRRIERRNWYARAKAASEEILQRMHQEHGLPVVIVRPGIVIGRHGSPFHWGVGMWWYESVCQLWGDGQHKLPLVLVEDVAKALVAVMNAPSVTGKSFNLVADPCLTAQEYLDAMERFGGFRIQRHRTPILGFYLTDLLKWMIKILVRHQERRFPSYRDWESRTNHAIFDCSAAKGELNWRPVSDRDEIIRLGIVEPLMRRFGP